MIKMTAVYLGVLVVAIYFSTQVHSQNSTNSMNHTSAAVNFTATTMSTNTGSNSTKASGAGTSIQSGAFSLLLPVVAATSLLWSHC